MSARTGRCLCGAVRLTLDLEKDEVTACHCAMCARWNGGPALSVFLSADRFEIEADQGALGLYASSDQAERGFCTICGASLFWRARDGSGVTVSAGCLDDANGLTLADEIYFDAKPDYYAFAGDRPRLTEAEVRATLHAETAKGDQT